MKSKLISNLWDNGELPTIETAVKIDSKPIIEGAAMLGICVIICVLIVLIFKTSKN